MADIAMCPGVDCAAKDYCYRHRAPVNPFWQSYFVESPGYNDECEYFIPDHRVPDESNGEDSTGV